MPELLQAVCGCLATSELQATLILNLSDHAYITKRPKLGELVQKMPVQNQFLCVFLVIVGLVCAHCYNYTAKVQ